MEIGDWGGWTGAALGLVAIVVSIVLYLRSRDRKTIDYAIHLNQRILATGTNLPGSVTISANGHSLTEPRLVVIRCANTGRREIDVSDYSTPITISYESNPPVAASILEERPPGTAGAPALDAATGKVTLQPTLLNSRDLFAVQLISDGRPGRIQVSCRVKGQSRPMKSVRTSIEPINVLFAWVVFVVLICTIAGIVVAAKPTWILATRYLLAAALGGSLVWAIWKAVQLHRRRKYWL